MGNLLSSKSKKNKKIKNTKNSKNTKIHPFVTPVIHAIHAIHATPATHVTHVTHATPNTTSNFSSKIYVNPNNSYKLSTITEEYSSQLSGTKTNILDALDTLDGLRELPRPLSRRKKRES